MRIALRVHQRMLNSFRRALESLGLSRRARDVTLPDPLEYARRVMRVKRRTPGSSHEIVPDAARALQVQFASRAHQ
jgi:hypothetical protein